MDEAENDKKRDFKIIFLPCCQHSNVITSINHNPVKVKMADTTMEEIGNQMAPSDTICHFLRIPKGVKPPLNAKFHRDLSYTDTLSAEIRLEIYRYLLLPSSVVYISPDEPPESTIHDRIADSEDTPEASLEETSENEWTDETDSDDNSMISEIMHDVERELFSDDDSSSDGSDDMFDNDDEPTKRDLAILRTNRQIYSEASYVFYSEAILTLEPGDIFCLARNPRRLEFGVSEEMAWKHNPLKGIGKKNKKGVVVYNTRPLSGDIEPHIFAKFQKISFDAYFDDDHTQPLEMWIDDDTHVVREEDASTFRRIFSGSNLIKDFVKILSNAPRITRLEIALEVEVLANSNLIMADLMEEWDDEDRGAQDKTEKIMDIANEKATELFLESGIMEPLKTLSNVSYCDLKFGFEHRGEGDEYKPPLKYVQMLKDMKETIESNFKEQVVEV